jgi:hypothetical protein
MNVREEFICSLSGRVSKPFYAFLALQEITSRSAGTEEMKFNCERAAASNKCKFSPNLGTDTRMSFIDGAVFDAMLNWTSAPISAITWRLVNLTAFLLRVAAINVNQFQRANIFKVCIWFQSPISRTTVHEGGK